MNLLRRIRILPLLLAAGVISICGGPARGADPDGVPLCTAAGDQQGPAIVADGSGGAVVAWHDLRPTVAGGGVCFAQRVNAAGVALWAANGVALSTTGDLGDPSTPAIVADGAGGAYVAYGGSSASPRVQWVNAAGAPQWGPDGVALTSTPPSMRDLAITRDVGGAGGVIVAWRQDNGAGGTADIYAQKVSSAGALQWSASAAPVTMTSQNTDVLPVLISDGAGGAILAWFYGTSGCHAQRLNASGTAIWSGTPLSSLSNNRRPAIVPDGSGGAVIAWAAGNTGIYVQRVNSSGSKQWSPNNTGVALCTAGNQCAMIPDLAGGATVVWQDYRTGTNYSIYAQKVNSSGSPQWTMNGADVCTAGGDQLAPAIVSDGSTGAIITWYDARQFSTGENIFAQRVDATGLGSWTPDGVPLCTAADDQQAPAIASDGANGAFVAWQDHRNGSNDDIYFHHLGSAGVTLSVPGGDASGAARTWPNPFLGRVELALTLSAAAPVRLEVFDVRGRSVHVGEPRMLPAGEHVLAWDGREADGRPAAPGVYFLRASGPGVALSRRVVRLE